MQSAGVRNFPISLFPCHLSIRTPPGTFRAFLWEPWGQFFSLHVGCAPALAACHKLDSPRLERTTAFLGWAKSCEGFHASPRRPQSLIYEFQSTWLHVETWKRDRSAWLLDNEAKAFGRLGVGLTSADFNEARATRQAGRSCECCLKRRCIDLPFCDATRAEHLLESILSGLLFYCANCHCPTQCHIHCNPFRAATITTEKRCRS